MVSKWNVGFEVQRAVNQGAGSPTVRRVFGTGRLLSWCGATKVLVSGYCKRLSACSGISAGRKCLQRLLFCGLLLEVEARADWRGATTPPGWLETSHGTKVRRQSSRRDPAGGSPCHAGRGDQRLGPPAAVGGSP